MAVWIAWFITHIPWTGLSADPKATWIVVGVWAIGMIAAGRSGSDARQSLLRGAASGLVTALVSLLLLGSKLNAQARESMPHPAAIAAGFVLFGTLLGLVFGLLGGLLRRPRGVAAWHSSFALTVVGIAAPLLFIGGLVTSTSSGMAVPDWPNTYSMNMFLYPLGTAPTDVFLEHSHRLFGSFLGLSALVLMIWTLKAEDRPWVRRWAVGIFLAVVLQGVLGGIRVQQGNADPTLDNRWYSMFHGVSAQLIFSALVALATFTTALYRDAAPDREAPGAARLRAISAAALHTTILQMFLGAMYRHVHSSHALWSHMALSLLVVIFATLTGFMAIRQGGNVESGPSEAAKLKKALSRTGMIQVTAVILQFVLGWAVLGIGGKTVNADSPLLAIIRTLHQANGALLLGSCTVAMVLARRLAPRR